MRIGQFAYGLPSPVATRSAGGRASDHDSEDIHPKPLRAIADALADTNEGLSGSEIGHLMATCHTDDPTPTLTKRHHLYNAIVAKQNLAQNRRAILEFIRQAMMLAHDLLQDNMFARLLVNATIADGPVKAQRAFVSILQDIGPLEALCC